jgi:hypothetical protein
MGSEDMLKALPVVRAPPYLLCNVPPSSVRFTFGVLQRHQGHSNLAQSLTCIEFAVVSRLGCGAAKWIKLPLSGSRLTSRKNFWQVNTKMDLLSENLYLEAIRRKVLYLSWNGCLGTQTCSQGSSRMGCDFTTWRIFTSCFLKRQNFMWWQDSECYNDRALLFTFPNWGLFSPSSTV